MKIIQLSDFHITSGTDINGCKKKIDKLVESVNQECNNEKLLFIMCGDVTDHGLVEGYQNAKILFDYIKEKFADKNISYEFVPGNHDLCNKKFSDFDNFIANYTVNCKSTYEEKNVILKEYELLNLILVNSINHKEYNYGSPPIKELEEVLTECHKPTIIVMHHTLMNRYDNDHAALTNSYKLIEIIEKNNVIGLLHGHTHGYSDISISKCKIIGVGPFFKNEADINNQYNIIKVVANGIQEIYNLRYSLDIDRFNKNCVYMRQNINIFTGIKTSKIYTEVLNATKDFGCINNLHIIIKTSLSDFINDMEEKFEEDIKKAIDWQLLEVPHSLYYNHGCYMKDGDKDGITYVINELKTKATSSRAIIPLINFKNVLNSGDNFLPSLDIIQFGFSNEEKTELYCTLYLRALEVNHFLKINLSEIYVMSKKIRDEIRSINKINITINAFRAQYKEKFGCFRKAEIDMFEERNIMKIVMEKQVSKIKDLIKEKLELLETVVKIEGVENLYKCLKDSGDNYYSKDLINYCSILVDAMQNLKKECEKTSNYVEISRFETIVSLRMEEFIHQLEVLERGI